MEAISSATSIDFPIEGGEIGALMRSRDWSRSPLGPPGGWRQNLKTALHIMLNSRQPMFVWWGEDRIHFYNDACISALGQHHPWTLGRPACEVWHEIWDLIGPQSELVLRKGQPSWQDKMRLVLERSGYPEEAYFTFSLSSIPDDHGGIGGVFCACIDNTAQILNQRRLAILRELADRAANEAKTVADACRVAAAALSDYPSDVPFALLYLVDKDNRHARLAAAARIASGSLASPPIITLNDESSAWPLQAVLKSRNPNIVTDLPQRFGPLPGGTWPESPTQACALPLANSAHDHLFGFLIVATSPRLPFNDDYQGFLELTAGQIATAIANARAYEHVRQSGEPARLATRELTEIALRDSEERLRLMTEAANVFTWEVDTATQELTCSGNVHKVLGFSLKSRTKDNGPLIHPEDRDRIREHYRRALQGEENYDVEYRLVNPHSDDVVCARVQGHLACDVQPKKARFLGITQNITERTSHTPRSEKAPLDAFLSYRILVVDDNRDVADSLGILLRLLGADTQVVHDGPAALAAIETFKPNVALLDLGMPGMSGYEVARRIRRQYSAHDIMLIALTGWGQEEDRRRARLMGLDYHLTKPADIKSLQECLSHLQHP